jgi:type IV pilus assembly protein PilV
MYLKMDDKRQRRQRRAGRGEHGRKGQAGVALLEALIAILIFSLGILTVIGIQATSIKMTADAQLRTRAALLADRLVGQMWVSGENIADLKTKFQTGGTAYNAWLADVSVGLPGVAGADGDDGLSTLPTVSVDDSAGTTSGQVIVTLYWRTPSMSADQRHRHIVTSQISRNP